MNSFVLYYVLSLNVVYVIISIATVRIHAFTEVFV